MEKRGSKSKSESDAAELRRTQPQGDKGRKKEKGKREEGKGKRKKGRGKRKEERGKREESNSK